MSPVGAITGSGANSVTLEVVDGQNAESRTTAVTGLAWQAGYTVDLINASTNAVIQTLTIDSVSGSTVSFTENLSISPTNTARNSSGLISSGHYIQYAEYDRLSTAQKDTFASYTRPTASYPTSKSKEVAEQRAGLHSFDDGGLPYVNYPKDYVEIT